MQSKDYLRKHAKELRKTFDIASRSSNIVKKIKESDEYQNAKNVMIFYPLKYEINLLELLEDDKSFYLPKVEGENLLVCPFKKCDKLVASAFNTLEPLTEPIDATCLDMVFVPALYVDKLGFRIGYGGGYYDRFLSQIPLSVVKAVVVFEEFFIEKVPSDSHDIKADIIFC